jgi:hypothetical protein
MGTHKAHGHQAVWMLLTFALQRTTTIATCIMYRTQELTVSSDQWSSSQNIAKYH